MMCCALSRPAPPCWHLLASLSPQWPPLLALGPLAELPAMVLDRYRAADGVCLAGLLPDLGRAWATVDASLFLWRLGRPRDVPLEYAGEEQALCVVGAVRPRPGVFIPAVRRLLVLATPAEVALLGVCCARPLAADAAAAAYAAGGFSAAAAASAEEAAAAAGAVPPATLPRGGPPPSFDGADDDISLQVAGLLLSLSHFALLSFLSTRPPLFLNPLPSLALLLCCAAAAALCHAL